MPFIEQWRRNVIDKHGLEALAIIEQGDRCYFFYSKMVKEWNANPRWATAHQLMKEMIEWIGAHSNEGQEDDTVAYWLAWQVFFQMHVMPYELHKRAVNGDI